MPVKWKGFAKSRPAAHDPRTKKGRPLESIPPMQVCKFAVEYEFFYDEVLHSFSQSSSSILALNLISRTPFCITLIEQRTKRVSGWPCGANRKFLLRKGLVGRWEITTGNQFGQDYRKRLKPAVNYWSAGARLMYQLSLQMLKGKPSLHGALQLHWRLSEFQRLGIYRVTLKAGLG